MQRYEYPCLISTSFFLFLLISALNMMLNVI